MTLLRAMDPTYSTNADIIRAFYPTETVKCRAENAGQARRPVAADDIIDPETGEVYLESGECITEELIDKHPGQRRSRKSACSARSRTTLILTLAQGRSDDDARGGAAEDLPAPSAGQPAAAGKGQGAVPREIPGSQPLSAGQGRPVPHQPQVQPGHPRDGDDAAARSTTSTPSATSSTCAAAKGTSTTSTIWATAGCGPSTSWRPTSCARASSSCAAPCRNACRSATSKT